MEGLSERQYAARVGLSRGAIQKAKATGRLVLHGDGSIDAEASDALRAQATDPSKTRKAPTPKLKPVPAQGGGGHGLRHRRGRSRKRGICGQAAGACDLG
jgi:hypothetical protein